MLKKTTTDTESFIFTTFARMGDFLQRHVFDSVSAISMGISNSSPPKGFTTQGASPEYDGLLESVQRTLNQSGQEIYRFLRDIYPEIDEQNNRKLKNELSSIGNLSNIFINNRTEAAHRVYETCKNMVRAHKKRNDKDAFINEVRAFKDKISQFSTLGSLKKYLEELNKGFDD